MAFWPVPVPVAAAGAVTEFGQDSGTQSGLPRHRRSTAVSFCLTAVSVPESMELCLLHNQYTGDGLGDTGVVAPERPVLSLAQRSSGVTGAAELGGLF